MYFFSYYLVLYETMTSIDLLGMPNDIVFLGWQIVDQNDVDD